MEENTQLKLFAEMVNRNNEIIQEMYAEIVLKVTHLEEKINRMTEIRTFVIEKNGKKISLKELTINEVAQKLAEEGAFRAYVKNHNIFWREENVYGVHFGNMYPIRCSVSNYSICAIMIGDKKGE